MDQDEYDYNGYRIESRPAEMANGKWKLKVFISELNPSELIQRPFEAGNEYVTKDEAVSAGFAFGIRIIDGQVEGCSVTGSGRQPG